MSSYARVKSPVFLAQPELCVVHSIRNPYYLGLAETCTLPVLVILYAGLFLF